MPRVNVERFYRGRSHRKGEGPSDSRESGATHEAEHTIREYRERAAQEADRRDSHLPEVQE